MAVQDFAIRHDQETDNPDDVVYKIFYSLFINRIRANKPCIIFMGGGSGEGKSLTAVKVQEILCKIQGIDIRKHFNVMNVYTPLEYPKKLEKLLFDKEHKKCNILCVHESRELISSKLWNSFITRSIADVNAMSRSVKRLIIIIVSQYIRDITLDIRYTLNYYCTVKRRLYKPAELRIHKLWMSDYDIEKPRFNKKKVWGYMVNNDGKYFKYFPDHFLMSKPSEDLIKIFDQADTSAKEGIIKSKMEKLMKEMEREVGTDDSKIIKMVDWYAKNEQLISQIGKVTKGKWKVHAKIKQIHDLTTPEVAQFEKKLNERLAPLKVD